MKIAFFSLASIAHRGGYEKQIINYAKGLSKLGHTITIVSLSESSTKKLGILLSFLHLHPRFSFPEILEDSNFIKNKRFKYLKISSSRELSRILDENEIAYAKNEILDSLFIFFTKRSIPVICGIHTVMGYTGSGLYESLHNLFYKSLIYFKILSTFSAFHSLNRTDEKFLKSKIRNKKIFYIPNFITTSNVISNKTNFFQIIYVGRLTKQKGIKYFLETAGRINNLLGAADIKFIICGSGQLENDVLQFCKNFDNIEYKGYISSEEMEQIYERTDLIFIPSEGETFSLACVEAQRYGSLAISFNNFGAKDVILNNKTGFIVPAGNIKLVQRHIVKLVELKNSKPAEFEKMKEFTRFSIRQRFSSNVILPKLERMLRDVNSDSV